MDGVLPTDRMAPIMPLVVHFGQEAWTGSLKFTDMLDCPPALKPMMAECPSNVISFYNMQEEELNEMPPGALRAVAKSICYAQQPEKLLHEWQTDPLFAPPWLDEMQDVIAIATGLDNKLLTEMKEENMQRKVSAIEEYFVNKGIIIGEAKGRAEGEVGTEERGTTACEAAREGEAFLQGAA